LLRTLSFLAVCLLAALLPVAPRSAAPASACTGFPGWPGALDGRPLAERALGAREARFAASFPGRIARFGDGRREWILRWVERPTRRLHASADCFRGLGYSIAPQPLERDERGRLWGVFRAQKGGERLIVRERIEDRAGSSWTDASAWWWAASIGRSAGPWWAYTSVERERPEAAEQR
jgi:hypothetical protein